MQPDILQDVSRESLEKLKAYHQLLLKWQKAINLVSKNTLGDAWNRHFVDSAHVAQYISPHVRVLADIGSGGGFPGLVLAMLRPDLEIHLIESDERKCQFLRTVSRETETPVSIHTLRVEDMPSDFTPDCVSARALADLTLLLDYCAPWAQRNPQLEALFMKGARAEEEIAQSTERYAFHSQSYPSATDKQAVILKISEISLRN